MRTIKKYCNTHCFNYNGNVCPFCENDKIMKLQSQFLKLGKKIKQAQEVTEEDINNLKLKFNGKI